MNKFLALLALSCLTASAEDRVLAALRDKVLAEQISRMKTDDRIAAYGSMVEAKPEAPQYQVLLAGAYIQKMRETTDFGYIDRAEKILQAVLSADNANYDALRLRTEIELERHDFSKVVKSSLRLVEISPVDAWNWGTLGDAYIELGDYDKAAESYQKMVNMRPDLASYNRAAHFRFLTNDMHGAVETMKLAIRSGSNSPENIAWCLVELGGYYARTKEYDEAEKAYSVALRTFPNYHPAYGALGKLQALKGETAKAIESFTRAQSITPLPDYAAGLYDLYTSAGKTDQAAAQKRLIETIDTLGKANGEKANRNLALIYADHNWNPGRALELATAELEFRKDIYTYDALAWALYKNGRLDESAKAMSQAMKLKTPEPSFQQHAKLIQESIIAAKQPKTAQEGQ